MTRWVMASGEGDPMQEVGGFREWESNVLSLRTEMSGTVLSSRTVFFCDKDVLCPLALW